MGHATKMFYIYHMIIQIHIYIVAVRLKGFHLTVTQDMLQGILSSGIVLKAIGYHFGEFVDQTPYIFLLITSFADFPVRCLIVDITVVTNRIVSTYGPIRKSLAIKTVLF